MSYLIANIVPALVIWGATSGIPLWLVLKRGYGADVVTRPAAKSTAALPADKALLGEAELLAHIATGSGRTDPVGMREPVAASR